MTVAITGATLIDGTGRDPVENAIVLIRDGRIENVGPANRIARPDEALETIDGEGQFILPGLVNMHEHLSYREILGLPSAVIGDPITTTVTAVRNSINAVSRGWTTVCDMASPYGIAAKIRDLVETGEIIGPRVVAAGTPIAVTGGHATGSGVLCKEADGPDQVRAAVRANFREGADFIKVMASHDPYCMPGDENTRPEMGLDEIRSAFDEARRWGKLTTSHVMGTVAIRNVIEAGVDILHHGTYLNEELAEQLAREEVFYCPTASAYQRQTMNPLFARGAAWAAAHQVLVEPHAESLQIAIDMGVRVVNGTDSTGRYAEDDALLRDAGMTGMESILACTSVAASALRLDDEIGTLERGKVADAILIDRDPLADPYALETVQSVVLRGVVHQPPALSIEGAEPTRFVSHTPES